MFGFFSKAPQRVPTDRVVPVGFFDDTILFRTFVLYTLFVFDDVLDAPRLRSSLESVVSRPGWNKLGARLRRNERGELEHHIPAAFDLDRPAIGYNHVDLSDVAIEDHPSGSRVPRPHLDRPAVVGDPGDLHDLVHGPGIPKGLNDYLYRDQPELGLRVVSFKNSTIVVLHWIHLAFDAMAKKSLIEAWMLALRGKHKEIPNPLGDDYALENVGKSPTKPHVLINQKLTMDGLISWVARNVYSLAICKKEHRMVCVPAVYLNKLREKAFGELIAAAAVEGTMETPFLSEGDVLVAVQQAYQWRPVLKDIIPPNRPFLNNCVGFLVTLMPAKDILQRPLGYLASRIRQSIKEQGSREQVESYAALVRQDPRSKAPPLLGKSSMQLFMFSNWKQANLYEFDPSAAAISPRDTPLMPSYVQTLQGPYNFADGIIIVGKDTKGNYWLSGCRTQGLWGLMENEMGTEEI